MFVQFYNRAIKTGNDEAGLPFYQNQVYVIIARDATNQVDRRADENDFDRFPEHYAAFLRATSKDVAHEGLVIEMWPMVNAAEVENLKAHGFFTVQQLAKVSPTTKKSMPPHIAVLVDQAVAYVKVAGDIGDIAQKIDDLTKENADLQETVSILRSENAVLKKQKAEAT